MTRRLSAGRTRYARRAGIARLQNQDGQNGNAGWVYIFSAGRDDLYKIGKAGNWENRLADLRVGNPFIKYVDAARVNNMTGVEKKAHKKFKDQRESGEFFEFDNDQLVTAKRFIHSFEGKIVAESDNDDDTLLNSL